MDDQFNCIKLRAHALRDNLISRENRAHEYIELLLKQLESSEEETQRRALEQIISSGKMLDYANFDRAQEALWKRMWDEAERILRRLDQ